MDTFNVDDIWAPFMSETDIAAVRRAGYGGSVAFGSSPCLLVIDATRNFTGELDAGSEDTAAKFPNSSEAATAAVPVVASLCEGARAAGVPIVYTRGPLNKDALTLGGWAKTNPKMLVGDDSLGESFLDRISPRDGDIVLEKLAPSAFFGTPLMRYLQLLKVDSLVICGASTSGCVRATTVDSFSHGLSTIVVSDGCWDRSDVGHALSLFDMHYKYSEVVGSARALDHFRGLGRDAGHQNSSTHSVS